MVMKLLSRAGHNPEASQYRAPPGVKADVPSGASITHRMAIGWCCGSLCSMEGQRKTARQGSESQVRLWRLLRCGVCDV